MQTLIDYSEIHFETNYNFSITNICEQEYNSELVSQLQGIYPSLSITNSFKNFDLLPTEEELVALNSLQVDLINEDEYKSEGHQGTIDKYEYSNFASMNRLYAEVKDYLNLLSSENEDISDKVAKVVNKLVGSVITA